MTPTKNGIIKFSFVLAGIAICSTASALKLKLECDVSVLKSDSGRIVQSSRDVVLVDLADVPTFKYIETHGALEIIMGTDIWIEGKGNSKDPRITDLSDASKWYLVRNTDGLSDSLLIDRTTGRFAYKSTYKMFKDEMSGVCKQVDTQKLKF